MSRFRMWSGMPSCLDINTREGIDPPCDFLICPSIRARAYYGNRKRNDLVNLVATRSSPRGCEGNRNADSNADDDETDTCVLLFVNANRYCDGRPVRAITFFPRDPNLEVCVATTNWLFRSWTTSWIFPQYQTCAQHTIRVIRLG
jgi:hypothetical protein